MSKTNPFNEIEHERTNLNLDKQFSILPTVIHLLRPLSGKRVIDVGCGDGFFTLPIADQSPTHVYGIDNCVRQIEKAEKEPHPRVSYSVTDMFDELPPAERVNAPFVLNYTETTRELRLLLRNFYQSLTKDGKLVAVVDLPKPNFNSQQRERKRQLSVVKTLAGELQDETGIKLDFYNGNGIMFSLSATYYTPQTITGVLSDVGFTRIQWHQPLIEENSPLSSWQDYQELCELGYITAEK